LSEIKPNPEINFRVIGNLIIIVIPKSAQFSSVIFTVYLSIFILLPIFFKLYIVVGLFPFYLSPHNNLAVVH